MQLESPYYAVIFTSTLRENTVGYSEMADRMEFLARQQPGYLGIDHARSEQGITISYWKDLAAIQAWKEHPEHLEAQEKGKSHWYEKYALRICKVEREYFFSKTTS